MENLNLLIPEIVLSLLALGLIAFSLFRARFERTAYFIALGTLALTCLSIFFPVFSTAREGFGTLWVCDGLSVFFKIIVILATAFTLLLSLEYPPTACQPSGLYAGMLLFSCVGMMLLASATDLLLLFVALELVSLTSFILTGFEKTNLRSSEAAIKYFLVGAFSSALTAYGISLFYGATGTTQLVGLKASGGLLLPAMLFITVGFGFKISMVPFHFWVPDAYEGAPTPITAFLSVAPKAATLAAFLRLFTILLPHWQMNLTLLFEILAILTMTVGNLVAIFQNNVKRLLAYSSIAQAGYILIGLVTGDPLGQEGVLIYVLAYLFMNMGAFAVAIAVANREKSYDLDGYNGLAQRSLGLSLMMTFFLLSLAGIPPLAGFIGKFYVFAAAIRTHFYVLAVVGVLNSVVSVYYYMRIAYRMFFASPRNTDSVPLGRYLAGSLILATLFIFLIGILPEPFIQSVKFSMRTLP